MNEKPKPVVPEYRLAQQIEKANRKRVWRLPGGVVGDVFEDTRGRQYVKCADGALRRLGFAQASVMGVR